MEDGKQDMEKEHEAPEFTEAELALMTDEERKAVSEDGPEDAEALEEEPDGEKEEDGGQQEEQQEEGQPGEERQEVAEKPSTSFVPFFQIGGSDEEIQTKLDELDKQLEEGDIDIIQYTKQRDPLIQQRTEARMAEKFNQQSAAQLWQYEQNLFFSSNPDYRDDPVLNGALQRMFKTLDTQENAHKTGFELLTEAKRSVDESLAARYGGAAARQGSSVAEQQQEPKAPKYDKPARERVKLPRTLAEVPIAEANDTGQGEFAHLDNLSDIEFEKALARLTPDQAERYLRQ